VSVSDCGVCVCVCVWVCVCVCVCLGHFHDIKAIVERLVAPPKPKRAEKVSIKKIEDERVLVGILQCYKAMKKCWTDGQAMASFMIFW
jgi:hypothetical protein